MDRYHNALNALGAALHGVDEAFGGLTAVVGDDGSPVADSQGVEPRLTDSWRELLGKLDEEMVVWARTFRKANGAKSNSSANGHADEDDREEVDPYTDAEGELTSD